MSNWHEYENQKAVILRQNLTPEQYEIKIRALAKRLGL